MHRKRTVNIPNNDSRIWDIASATIEIVDAIHNNELIDIVLDGEGPCATSLGLYKLLDQICNRFEYSKQNITIITHNLLEEHPEYNIKIHAPFKHVLELQQELNQSPAKYKQITASTKHFGNFVGHGNRIRLEIGSYLWKHHGDKTLQTYHCVPTEAYHTEFIGLEDLWFHNYGLESVERAVEFLQQTPFTFDDIQFYPILDKKMYGVQDAYQHFFADIAYTTFFTGGVFYMDEKLWRPIITKTPFMLHGPRYSLINLRKMGFKTFDHWWDEGYSEDPPDYQVTLIKENIDQLSKLSIQELATMYEEMKPVLDHNYNLFMELTESHFTSPIYTGNNHAIL